MNIAQLRHDIRRTLRRQIREAARLEILPPGDFVTFRRRFTEALAKASAPDELIYEANYLDYEGGPVFEAMWRTWDSIENELSEINDSKEKADAWLDMIEYYVHDSVVDMLTSYQNPEDDDRQPRFLEVDASRLALDTVTEMKNSASPAQNIRPQKSHKSEGELHDIVSSTLNARLRTEGFDTQVKHTMQKNSNERVTEIFVTSQKQSEGAVLDNVENVLVTEGIYGQLFDMLPEKAGTKFSVRGVLSDVIVDVPVRPSVITGPAKKLKISITTRHS